MCFFFMYLFIYVMNKIVLRNVYDWLENFDDMVKYINCTCVYSLSMFGLIV